MNSIKDNELVLSYLKALQEKYDNDQNAAVYDSYTQEETDKLFPIIMSLFEYNDEIGKFPEIQGLSKNRLSAEDVRGVAIKYNSILVELAHQNIAQIKQDQVDELWHKKKLLDLTPAQFKNILIDIIATAKSQGLL